jgi:hypothetical protein
MLSRLWMAERRTLHEVAAALARPWSSVKLKIYALRLVRGDRGNATWTAGQTDELRRLWARGDTFQEIADALGMTRNTVSSRAKRLGLGGRKRGRKARPHARPKDVQLKSTRRGRPRRAVESHAVDTYPSLAIPFLDLKPGQCRWPHGEGPFLFCGHAVRDELSSYCPHHHSVAYLPEEAIAEETRQAA